jgi:3-phenylpropionate/cinnamic acid dioxygenase small subunit
VTGLLDDKDAHAWVVLFDGETKYLLETAMDGDMSRRYPPRLELATRYLPTEMMFDDRGVWLNRGQQRVRDYGSPSVWSATAEEAP